MSMHSGILAWEIPWTEEPGGLYPCGHKESDTTEHHHANVILSEWSTIYLSIYLLKNILIASKFFFSPPMF